jgi:DNA-directed RNA polymerase subunit E'/Rpb7
MSNFIENILIPYRSINQYTRIQIQPHMMNSDIENNMEIVLKKKVEGKCNRYGFVNHIYQIDSYEENIMLPENLSGAASYNITYHCNICIPVENTIVVASIKAINPELIIASNGPIIIFIPKTNIDSHIWNISNEFTHKKTNTLLKATDYVKILIEKTKINQGDIQIKCIGKLLEHASEEEVTKYYGSNKENTVNKNESNFII